jgi:dihydrodipicolinate synthase/N-acetylneuraminate lyase
MASGAHITADGLAARIRPCRRIEGISAVLLPYDAAGRPDYEGLAAHVARTADAGLIPAVNMDTGYVHLLSPEQRREVLRVAVETLSGQPLVAGAYVQGVDGPLIGRCRRAIEEVEAAGGTPVLFQCSELCGMPADAVEKFYREATAGSERVIAFELGRQFAPFGRVYDAETVRRVMAIAAIVGMKHSSLDRRLEWERLEFRDRTRPNFKIYTGNDLAIDMVIYGSDYLLGLSSFCPEAFALRDRLWAEGDVLFYELNDLLQYLGCFAFRPPVPAYKHSAAQFLRLTGHIRDDSPPPGAPRRPESDVAVLAEIAERIAEWTHG